MENTCAFEVKVDSEPAVLEIQEQGSKSMKDTPPSTFKCLLEEMEEAGIVDTTLCCHEIRRRAVVDGKGLRERSRAKDINYRDCWT